MFSSKSMDKSPASMVSKSTRASSGSILLTSISLTTVGAGLCAPLLGVVGVLGRESGVRFVGEVGFDSVLERASDDNAALYFFVHGGTKLGVVAREGARLTSSQDTEESSRFGVKGVGRAILLGVGGTDIRVS